MRVISNRREKVFTHHNRMNNKNQIKKQMLSFTTITARRNGTYSSCIVFEEGLQFDIHRAVVKILPTYWRLRKRCKLTRVPLLQEFVYIEDDLTSCFVTAQGTCYSRHIHDTCCLELTVVVYNDSPELRETFKEVNYPWSLHELVVSFLCLRKSIRKPRRSNETVLLFPNITYK